MSSPCSTYQIPFRPSPLISSQKQHRVSKIAHVTASNQASALLPAQLLAEQGKNCTLYGVFFLRRLLVSHQSLQVVAAAADALATPMCQLIPLRSQGNVKLSWTNNDNDDFTLVSRVPSQNLSWISKGSCCSDEINLWTYIRRRNDVYMYYIAAIGGHIYSEVDLHY